MDRLHYIDLGLDDIYLAGGFEINGTKWGKKVRIHDVYGLRHAIAKICHRVSLKVRLLPSDKARGKSNE